MTDKPTPDKTGAAVDSRARPEPDWAVIEIAYQSDTKLHEIAAAHGLMTQTITARARREKWPLRKDRQCVDDTSSVSAGSKPPVSPATLLKRMTALIERQIAEIEAGRSKRAGAADQERDARTLSNLARTFDKLIELKRDADAARAAKRRAQKEEARSDGDERDDEIYRVDLARRLARLATDKGKGEFS